MLVTYKLPPRRKSPAIPTPPLTTNAPVEIELVAVVVLTDKPASVILARKFALNVPPVWNTNPLPDVCVPIA